MGRKIDKLESDLEQTRAIAEDLRGWQEGILSRLDKLEKNTRLDERLKSIIREFLAFAAEDLPPGFDLEKACISGPYKDLIKRAMEAVK